jgi:hypothetical protein
MVKAKEIDREEKIVRGILKKWTLPPNVHRFDVDFGEDSTGDPAVWIWLTVDDELQPSPQSIAGLNSFVTDVRSDILRAGLRHWPYVRFRPAH